MTLGRRAAAEALGTMFLVAAVVGSGIMGDRLSGGNAGIALLANAIATGAVLIVIILVFGGISGAHFNPVVTVAMASQRSLHWQDVPPYLVAQIAGAFAGVATAHLMFDERLFTISQHARSGGSQVFSEFIATFGLLLIIWGCVRVRKDAIPLAVGAYIAAGYWFTSSTSFANPAVTLARSVTNTFSGIRPLDVPGFVVAQCIGAIAATLLVRWLLPPGHSTVEAVVSHTSKKELAGRVR